LRAMVQAFEAQLSAAERTWDEVVALMSEPARSPSEAQGRATTPTPEAPRQCVVCARELPARPSISGARPRYCGDACRKAAAKRRASSNGASAPVAAWERPSFVPVEDAKSDPASLKPPARCRDQQQ
jgi:hypothetical protein